MIYLIDFENVHEDGFQVIGRLGDKDAVYCFFTKNVAKVSMSALAGIRSGQLHFIETESGKQSLDLALVSYLGFLIGTKPQELYYDIISNDNGFTKAVEFWNKRIPGIRVRLRKTNAESKLKTNVTQSSAQMLNTTVSTNNPNTAKTAPATAEKPAVTVGNPAVAPKPALSTMTNKVEANVSAPSVGAKPAQTELPDNISDSAISAALEAAGLDPMAADFLQQQLEKFKSDRNVKQLVYRAVVKKYGQRDGTKIYNSTKKLLLK